VMSTLFFINMISPLCALFLFLYSFLL